MLTFAAFVTNAIAIIIIVAYVVGWILVFFEALFEDKPSARAAAVATIWPASAASLLWRRR